MYIHVRFKCDMKHLTVGYLDVYKCVYMYLHVRFTCDSYLCPI